MTITRKVDLLYQKAHGQGMNASPAEQRELHKYKVNPDEGNLATKANIRAYIQAVDSGCHRSFYDWCIDNRKGDRRRKGHSAAEMASNDRERTIASMLIGWLLWGVAIYWAAGQALPVGTCAIAGAILSAVLYRLNRNLVGFTLIILPAIVAYIATR